MEHFFSKYVSLAQDYNNFLKMILIPEMSGLYCNGSFYRQKMVNVWNRNTSN